MHCLYSVAELRALEQRAAALLAPGALMERAGQAAAALALTLIGARAGEVLVLAGPGNNGGDAFEAAANLAEAGIAVALIHLAGSGTVSAETARAMQRVHSAPVRRIDALPDGLPDGLGAPGQWALVIDGLFGIGLTRALSGAARQLTLAVSELDCPVLALDIPSGLDADTGALVGPGVDADGVAVAVALRASHTITFLGDKPGLHTNAGRDYAGAVSVAALGIDAALLPAGAAWLNAPALFASRLTPRQHNTHKGSFGDVAIVGGAQGMAGAAVLAARAALFAGVGRVYVAALDRALTLDSVQPEIMFRDAASFAPADATLVLGPGMGDSASAIRLVGQALDGGAPLVLDADALNLLAASPALQQRLAARAHGALLTPHPLEAARLLGVTAAVVQGDRLAAAREIAARLQAVVVLKGSGTVIANAAGQVVINPTGNPGLASGGSGDVLAGVCGALLAQGWSTWEAALGAVWLHGAAADRLVGQGIGPVGLTAGELPVAVRWQLNSLVGHTVQASPPVA